MRNEFEKKPLTAACQNNSFEVVKYLVESCHVDVNLFDVRWKTPLTAACENNSFEVVKYLVETCHADINLFKYCGRNQLQLHVRIIVLK